MNSTRRPHPAPRPALDATTAASSTPAAPPPPPPRSASERPKTGSAGPQSRLFAALVAILAVLASMLGTASPAQAASVDVGVWFEVPASQDHQAGFAGAYLLPNGSRAYCIDYYADSPMGEHQDAGNITEITARPPGTQHVDGQALAMINYALGRWGQTSDPDTAAAMQMFIWDRTLPSADGVSGTASVGLWQRFGSHHDDVRSAYDHMTDAASAAWRSGDLSRPELAQPTLDLASADSGTAVIPEGWQRAELGGAVWHSTSHSDPAVKTVRAGGAEYQLHPSPSDTESTAEVTLTVSATVSTAGQSSEVTLWNQQTPDQQRLISASTGTETLTATVTDSLRLDFVPGLSTRVADAFVDAGEKFSDTVSISVADGTWRTLVGGKPVELTATGTLYGPFRSPPGRSGTVPDDAPLVDNVTLVVSAEGSYPVTAPATARKPGFYTWVWRIVEADQSDAGAAALRSDVVDDFGIPAETSSVRAPLTVTSTVREYNVAPGGRAFDSVTVSGFPQDHPDFTGDDTWGADEQTLTHTVYGPFANDDQLDDGRWDAPGALEDAPVLTTVTTAATNGTVRLGYDDPIRPTAPGYYVVVSEFSGDDRVLPFRSSTTDILERFFVPGPTPPAVSVITQADRTVKVGEDFGDTALVQGPADALAGSYLVFRAYGPVPTNKVDSGSPGGQGEATPRCDSPFFTSDQVSVDGPGFYRSGTTWVAEPGNVYWIETLHAADGSVLDEGECGAPGETTVVTEPKSAVVTRAQRSVELGEPATDTAIVSGEPPTGSTLTFSAYRQKGTAPKCTASTLAFDGTDNPVEVTGPGEYTGPETTFDKPGRYYWVETLRDPDGEVLHEGECGARYETTTVRRDEAASAEPLPPAATPAALATTGSPLTDTMVPLGATGLALLAAGAVLAIIRRLRGGTTR